MELSSELLQQNFLFVLSLMDDNCQIVFAEIAKQIPLWRGTSKDEDKMNYINIQVIEYTGAVTLDRVFTRYGTRIYQHT